MEVLAIIAARGGSKRLPGKNIKPMCGVPLICHAVRAALDAPSVARVVVSTDCERIQREVTDYLWETERNRSASFDRWSQNPDPPPPEKAQDWAVPFTRPARLATDTATSEDVVIHALDWLLDNEGYEPDLLILLQPTSPLRTAVDVEMALTIRGGRTAGYIHGYSIECKDEDNLYMDEPLPVVSFNAATGQRNGALYVATPYWLRTVGDWTPATHYPMPPERSVDIDTQADWNLAEWLMSQR